MSSIVFSDKCTRSSITVSDVVAVSFSEQVQRVGDHWQLCDLAQVLVCATARGTKLAFVALGDKADLHVLYKKIQSKLR